MAHPSGRAYHYGEHRPLAEHGKIGVIHREQPLHVSGAEGVGRTSPEQLTPTAPTYRGMVARQYWNTTVGLVHRFPVASSIAALAVGLAAAIGLRRLTPKR
jgi:hypothetical protein